MEEEIKGEDVYAAPADVRKNVVKKKVIQVSTPGNPGDIAHYHKKENETEEWEEPCYWVKHYVDDPTGRGYGINEKRYMGEVVVPQCTADYLACQESLHKAYEDGVFRGKKHQRIAGSF